MNVDKILDRKYQMTDAGKIDTIRELYTVFSPNVNLEALKKSDFFPALEQMMEPVLDVPDERSPQVMAYWAKRGMVKEFHGYDEPTDWDDYEAKTGYRWKAEEHRVIQNEHRIWTSFVPVSAFAPGVCTAWCLQQYFSGGRMGLCAGGGPARMDRHHSVAGTG